jgi:hypothetical protein
MVVVFDTLFNGVTIDKLFVDSSSLMKFHDYFKLQLGRIKTLFQNKKMTEFEFWKAAMEIAKICSAANVENKSKLCEFIIIGIVNMMKWTPISNKGSKLTREPYVFIIRNAMEMCGIKDMIVTTSVLSIDDDHDEFIQEEKETELIAEEVMEEQKYPSFDDKGVKIPPAKVRSKK